ncbi:glycosyltransferase family 4 protein [Geobacillus stearothermophilus]|uniref:glycosyltransferase family 4 protein n=1 Tax=Geobacillus stearothermophilus TaxID=1422 RepID=UPI0007ABC39B
MSKKNIVFVLNDYNGHGGAQRVAAILANEFSNDGHHVAVLSINEQENQPSYFAEHIPVFVLHKDGYRAPVPKSLYSNLKALKIRTVARELNRRRQLSKRRKDVIRFFERYGDETVYVIVVQVWGMQWLTPLLYKPNIKIIGQSHESYEASKNSQRYKRILRYYRQVSKFLLLTEKDAEKFKKDGFTNTGVMYNPTTFRVYNDPRKLYANKTVVSMGRLVDGKGFDVLIKAFARVSHEIPEWKLDIYGDGPEKESLQTLIDVLNMKNVIHLKGTTSKPQEVLSSSSFFVLASEAEGLPMSLIEAQSCGLPCISTDCAPGIREIINEYEDGLIAPVGDVDVLARHIRRLAKNEQLFYSYSQNAYRHSEKFEQKHIRDQWYKLFEELEER